MQSEDYQECNGTGTAELICGYERPCDACHGKGERPARKDNPMTDELVEQLLGPEGDLCAALCSRAADRITALSAEVARLNRLINSTGDHWLALVAVHPVQWEGAIDAAMEAACNEIKRLAALGAKP
jgi:hypothetical protein